MEPLFVRVPFIFKLPLVPIVKEPPELIVKSLIFTVDVISGVLDALTINGDLPDVGTTPALQLLAVVHAELSLPYCYDS